ncbi:hypothetical protein PG993_007330 [Apiospora rasikravindrae]|uniref:Uncharacterized protein n=1 Tax=Apiospora rasikravindrae TaxID=990691 RepID=A0ABR1SX72_9PEZI
MPASVGLMEGPAPQNPIGLSELEPLQPSVLALQAAIAFSPALAKGPERLQPQTYPWLPRKPVSDFVVRMTPPAWRCSDRS